MKLYIIVSSALSTGLKCAQAVHAFRSFCGEYPFVEAEWHKDNNIVVLQHDDVVSEAERLEAKGYQLSRFYEPDLDNELTAICVEPRAQRVLASLRLAA